MGTRQFWRGQARRTHQTPDTRRAIGAPPWQLSTVARQAQGIIRGSTAHAARPVFPATTEPQLDWRHGGWNKWSDQAPCTLNLDVPTIMCHLLQNCNCRIAHGPMNKPQLAPPFPWLIRYLRPGSKIPSALGLMSWQAGASSAAQAKYYQGTWVSSI